MRILLAHLVVAMALSGCSGGGGGGAAKCADGSPMADTDADGISDAQEERTASTDTDGDQTPDWQDLDSDADGITDASEAGDADVCTAPRDTESDGVPDYRDVDSDGDWLADGYETGAVTNPLAADSDGDGFDDLVELALGTGITNGASNPAARGELAFLYPPGVAPTAGTLSFATAVQHMDVYWSIDDTGSMAAELAALGNPTTGIPAVISGITCMSTGATCVRDGDCAGGEVCGIDGACLADPAVNACIPNLWTGIATWNDLDTFRNRVSLQSNPATTASAIPGTGAGMTEAVFQPAFCAADATACLSPVKNCATSGIGCAGFREDAVRLYIQVSDADNQCLGTACPNYTATTAGNALLAQSIFFAGAFGTDDNSVSNPETPQSTLQAIGIASGTVLSSGQPLVFSAVDAAAVTASQNAILTVASGLPMRFAVTMTGGVLAVERMVVATSGCGTFGGTEDTNGDALPDVYTNVVPGAPLCWELQPSANTAFPSQASVGVTTVDLTAEIVPSGSPTSRRRAYFVVPPTAPLTSFP